MNDLIHYVCEEAAREYAGCAGLFSGATFAHSLAQVAKLDSAIDGRYVRVMLIGRTDVEILSGGSHYRLKRGD